MDITLERIMSLMETDENGKIKKGEKKKFGLSIGLKSGDLISQWLSGQSDTYKDRLYEIAVKYNVSVEWLKGETDIKNPAPKIEDELQPDERALIDAYRQLPVEGKNSILLQALSAMSHTQKKEV